MAYAGAFAIGGLVGLGSFLYALSAAADWMEDPELLDSASTLTRTIKPELIRADQLFDIMKGSAGTLLSLLFFVQVAKTRGILSQPALDLAMVCGQHLLYSRTPSHGGLRAWPGAYGPPCAGFLHGATGISYALARLYAQTKEEEFREAAFEGFAFERSLYVAERHGWRDPRSHRIMERGSWCHGAAGIALGRLGCLDYLDVPALRHDLEEALSIASALPEAPDDQLCCGNFGRIDVLHTAGMVLNRLQSSARALASARKVIERASVKGFRFSTPINGNHGQHVYEAASSLFLGLAGVGYTLLRLYYPDLLPSVLLMETQV
jgi:lantibiotic modifying enzyme